MKYIKKYKEMLFENSLNESNKPIVYQGVKFHLSVSITVSRGVPSLYINLIPNSKGLEKIGDNKAEWGEVLAKYIEERLGIKELFYDPNAEAAGFNFKVSEYNLADIMKKRL